MGVFFRAGALAALEEARDDIVLKLVRGMQGEIYGRFGRREYQKRFDQRNLMIVVQRNFRKFMQLRSWGWFIIIQKTKPLIGQENLEDQLKALEDKANEAYGAYKDQVDTKAKLLEENEVIKEETKALIKQLEQEQGNLSEYTDRQTAAVSAKAEMEVQLEAATKKLADMEVSRQNATSDKKALEGENVIIKKDIEDLELAIQKLEQEKTNRDHSIRSLNDEIASQDEVINKLNKEKKLASENSSKATEDFQVAEDKVSHLNKIKSKLEQTLDELEDSLNKEKKARANIEKERRSKEGELKVAQEMVSDLERNKKELEMSIGRKEKDTGSLASKLEY